MRPDGPKFTENPHIVLINFLNIIMRHHGPINSTENSHNSINSPKFKTLHIIISCATTGSSYIEIYFTFLGYKSRTTKKP